MTGIVLSAMPMGEYDKRVVILTKERGKITAFAKGARRQNSSLLAVTNSFAFGEFVLYEGRSSYTLMQAGIKNYFRELSADFQGAYYGFYFCEFADYYTRENNDELEMLKLLYQSLRALSVPSIPNVLIRYIFELKALIINGECPQNFEDFGLSTSALYTMQYIAASPVEKLYTFVVTEEVLQELKVVVKRLVRLCVDHHFKSLEILEACLS